MKHLDPTIFREAAQRIDDLFNTGCCTALVDIEARRQGMHWSDPRFDARHIPSIDYLEAVLAPPKPRRKAL